MHRSLRLTALLLAASVSTAAAEGVNLAWNDCGTFGQSSQTFDCLSNTGTPFALIASFVPPPNVNEFLGLAAQIDVSSSTGTLPDWWKHGTSQCRGTSGIGVTANFAALPTSCTDFYNGNAVSGFLYEVGNAGPNRATLKVQTAVPFDNRGPIDPGTEYNAFRVNVQRAKSAAAGACSGCTTPTCLVLNSIQLYQPPEAGYDPVVSGPMHADFVTWQSESVAGCPLSTPAKGSTWGQVKTLYR